MVLVMMMLVVIMMPREKVVGGTHNLDIEFQPSR